MQGWTASSGGPYDIRLTQLHAGCSQWGVCGNTKDHCDAGKCINQCPGSSTASRCSQQGGSCKWSWLCKSPDYTRTGLCPGPANFKCCFKGRTVPPPAPTSSGSCAARRNPHAIQRKGSSGRWTPMAQFVVDELWRCYKGLQVSYPTTYISSSAKSDHPGNGIDVWPTRWNNRATGTELSNGWKMVNWLSKYHCLVVVAGFSTDGRNPSQRATAPRSRFATSSGRTIFGAAVGLRKDGATRTSLELLMHTTTTFTFRSTLISTNWCTRVYPYVQHLYRYGVRLHHHLYSSTPPHPCFAL